MTLARCAIAILLFVLVSGPAAADALRSVHYDLKIFLDPAARTLRVAADIMLDGEGATRFFLDPRFRIESAALGDEPIEWDLESDRYVSLSGEGPHHLVLGYAGTLDPFPEEGRRNAAQPLAGPEGAYLPGFSGWFPRFGDIPYTYTLSVDVPAPYKAVAPGEIKSETDGKEIYAARFEVPEPSDHLVLMAGIWDIQEEKLEGLTLRTYFAPDLKGLSAPYLADVRRYITRYSEQIGPYPFAAFHVISAPLPVGLGYRNMTYIGERVLRLPFIRTSSLPHEVLHNWWGNGVYTDYQNGNWAEGLTTFMADYALARERGPVAGRTKRLEWLRDYAALPTERDTPARAFIAKSHGASQVIGYNKVAFIFHMLQRDLGETLFNQVIQKFWRDNKFKTAGWAELEQAVTEVSGLTLSEFFSQWLDRSGAPVLTLEAGSVLKLQGGQAVSLTVRQTSPLYRLSIPVRIDTIDGPEDHTLFLDTAQKTFTIPVAAAPLSVAVDPAFDLFRKLDAAEAPAILRDVTLASEVDVVIVVGDPALRGTAYALAGRMLDGQGTLVDPRFIQNSTAPLLVIGTYNAVNAVLVELQIRPPGEANGAGVTAAAWATRLDGNRPVLLVRAKNGAALQALLRPLPHYGRRGWVVFTGETAVDRGDWPMGNSPLKKTF
ncbi:MAG: M1 family metallopeptidase [Magnetospiraceae bacterium]